VYTVIVEFTVNPDSRDQFMDRMLQQASDSLSNEEQCHTFDVAVDDADNNKIMLYELYTDKAAFQVHLDSDHFKTFDNDVQGMITNKKVWLLNRVS
jgi:autoinducer 2-degrading protein